VLRQKFLHAGLGITGANFLIAESGAVVLVENEGNIRLTTSVPRVHVAIAGIEKVIPRAGDLAVFLKLLARHGSGQPLTSYTSFLSGPRRNGEGNGPEKFYLLLLDNGRSRILADAEKRQTLYCIRCGACANVCPVYRRIGGHAYPGTYSGPIGAILTPQFQGLGFEPYLPFASSLCGACGEVCPVKIDIPRMLLALRRDVKGRAAPRSPRCCGSSGPRGSCRSGSVRRCCRARAGGRGWPKRRRTARSPMRPAPRSWSAGRTGGRPKPDPEFCFRAVSCPAFLI
jgi:L-lactate dehydrogenase complex protein LldF